MYTISTHLPGVGGCGILGCHARKQAVSLLMAACHENARSLELTSMCFL